MGGTELDTTEEKRQQQRKDWKMSLCFRLLGPLENVVGENGVARGSLLRCGRALI